MVTVQLVDLIMPTSCHELSVRWSTPAPGVVVALHPPMLLLYVVFVIPVVFALTKPVLTARTDWPEVGAPVLKIAMGLEAIPPWVARPAEVMDGIKPPTTPVVPDKLGAIANSASGDPVVKGTTDVCESKSVGGNWLPSDAALSSSPGKYLSPVVS